MGVRDKKRKKEEGDRKTHRRTERELTRMRTGVEVVGTGRKA